MKEGRKEAIEAREGNGQALSEGRMWKEERKDAIEGREREGIGGRKEGRVLRKGRKGGRKGGPGHRVLTQGEVHRHTLPSSRKRDLSYMQKGWKKGGGT
jgi:hypothetical protein